MADTKYPTLLNKRARILANLNRMELVILSIIYLSLSMMKVDGVKIILVNVIVLILVKYFNSRTPRGFFKLIYGEKDFNWSGELRSKNEN